ncbi:hypothetical protein GSI_07732 [Ganoderma sinense ZZ0214-1]|uniref:Uncharacterized protein n=1 Tax=Ganoderma sinense ZZ0214-1 TaxID=1077348 RepID=A0A2G8S8M0_9APHY|nr:hypothetical protein GSI_07703 [Ganoderma sinense ZZ0214-1]PIL30154.1 hypothetical protein GSI_07732 [Ganoderma sinense ZZ0214-1]
MPPVPAFGEQTPSFQTLVAAVSRSIQDDERSVPIDVIDMDPEEMSSEDERALIEALKKWKGGELRMPEVFEALSKTNGHTETGGYGSPLLVVDRLTMAAEWKTWFITNFEKLNSKVDLTPTTQQRVSAGGTPATAFGGNGTSRNRPGAKRQPSRSSATRRMDEHPRSRSAPRAASARRRSRHVIKKSGPKTTSKWTRVLSRAGEHPCPVTPEDLRAMAQYLFEKGDDDPDTLRRYNSARWREFAARPENHKRTLDGWACIPRLHPKHAAEIERYLKGFQKDADTAKSMMAVEASSSSPQ